MKLFRRLMWWAIAILASMGMVGCVLYYMQDKIIFHPGSYSDLDVQVAGVERLTFTTGDGEQVAYYLPPEGNSTGSAPRKLWLMFCGNASLALDLRFLGEAPDGSSTGGSGGNDVGFLFIDYPGYGECAGRPSRTGILDNVADSVAVLAGHLGVGERELWERAECFGHSLGAAVALETAATHGIEDVVAVSPFKSIEAMAARTTGAPVSGWIRHNFDNELSLKAIAALPGAKVHLFHGGDDRAIPVEMGRNLAAAHPEVVEYTELEDTGHNDILGKIADDLRAHFHR